jgi:hypothetical protein
MDRKTNTAAVLLMTAGLFYQRSHGTPPSTVAQTGTNPPVSGLGATVKLSSELGPWTPVCRYVGQATEEAPAPAVRAEVKFDGSGGSGNFSLSGTQKEKEGELKDQFCLNAGWHVTTLIATVPNPELTHLSLAFDRYVESITWALSDGNLDQESYTFDSYWFPWRPDQKEEAEPEKRKASEKDREKRSDTPGILVFRRNLPRLDPAKHPQPEKELLLVFLVGETPTSGINRVAFDRAWTYATELADRTLPICGTRNSPKQCVGIVGPSFTGSLPSLRLLLDRKHAGSDPHRTIVISGAVTGEESNTRQLRDGAPFCTTVETDQNSWEVFRQFLNHQSMIDGEILRHFALLGEDETEYGNGKRLPEGERVLTLRFPRGIARIRNSTEELPGVVNPSQAYPALPLVLRDTGQDSIPSFSQQQSPVSQEAVLMELASTLRRERIRYVGVVATDSLDALFVTRAIHALAPNIRIVLFNADLLFARASQNWGLSGVLAVTSYPLISRNQYYGGAVRPRRAQFSSDASEGEYNACRRMLLNAPDSKPDTKDELSCSAASQTPGRDYLLDYAAPFAEQGHTDHKPSVWLTMLGRSEWWPVAASAAGRNSPLLPGPAPGSHATEQFSVENSPQPWFLFFWVTWIACTLHVAIVYCMNSGYPRLMFLWHASVLRRLAWGYRRDLTDARRVTLAGASLTVAFVCCALAVVISGSGLKGWGYQGWGYIQLTLAIVTGAAAMVQAVWAVWRLKDSRRIACLFGVAAVALLEIGGACYAAFANPVGHAREFAGYRAVHLESGTSPALPIVILLVAIYLFCWARLARLRMSEERQAKPPKDAQDPDDNSPKPFADCAIPDKAVHEVGAGQKAFLGVALVGWCAFFNPFSALATVEGVFYDLVLFVLATTVVMMFALVLVRFLVTWRVLRKLLQDLERHPLRYAFTRLPKTFSWTTVWAGDPRPQLIMPSRALDVLRMMPEAEVQDEVKKIENAFQSLKGPTRRFMRVPKLVANLNDAMNRAFVFLSKKRQPAWRKGISDSLESQENKDKKEETPAELREDRLSIARDEFLALRFVTFIAYTLRVIRGFLKFLASVFILLVIALSAYPFEGRRYIETAILFLFVVSGASVALVFAQMDRDPLLSRLSETKPNELGVNFVFRLVSFGALPLLTVLASQVPDIGNFLLSWLQPALQSVK